MAKELWDVLDKNGEPTGKTVSRGFKGAFPKGKYHLVVHIWIKNSKGEFLIQKRSSFKQPMAGEWAATGGAVVAGEESREGAKRELFEELGITPSDNDFTLVKRLNMADPLRQTGRPACFAGGRGRNGQMGVGTDPPPNDQRGEIPQLRQRIF